MDLYTYTARKCPYNKKSFNSSGGFGTTNTSNSSLNNQPQVLKFLKAWTSIQEIQNCDIFPCNLIGKPQGVWGSSNIWYLCFQFKFKYAKFRLYVLENYACVCKVVVNRGYMALLPKQGKSTSVFIIKLKKKKLFTQSSDNTFFEHNFIWAKLFSKIFFCWQNLFEHTFQ